MKKITWSLVITILILGLAACSSDENEPPTNDNNNELNQENEEQNSPENVEENDGNNNNDEEELEENSNEAPDLAQQIEEKIEIEGMEEDVTLELYDPSIANFRTYIPSDLVAEEVSGGESDSFWFYANYDNNKNEDVFVQLSIFSEVTEERPGIDDDNHTLSIMLQDMEAVNEGEKRYDWSLEEFKSPGEPRYAMIGQHSGQYFVIVLDYPIEHAEGFMPRVNKILEHFYWTDTEEYLSE